MPKPVIQVENLSKAYRIGLKEEIPDSLMGAVTSWVKAPLRNWRRLRSLNTFNEAAQKSEVGSQTSENSSESNGTQLATANGTQVTKPKLQSTKHEPDDIVWALKDVSFDVHEGEVVGIIGRNGAGKSTLLKVLSRITEPTSGRAVIRGRVSSLLEVGTGFHPELSGRENIYMNGTILGMTKKEIDRKFDEIVDFSGVEKFLDTPIKRYSSGMKVRLAFAVAAHLDPEILIIDEVLAVGDAEFQTKCLGQMKDAAYSGRTIMFVSHNMAAIRDLCSRAIYVDNGAIREDATVEIACDNYIHQMNSYSQTPLANRNDRQGTGDVRLTQVFAKGHDGTHGIVTAGHPAEFTFEFQPALPSIGVVFTIYDGNGTAITTFCSDGSPNEAVGRKKNISAVSCLTGDFLLRPGEYRINVGLRSGTNYHDHITSAAHFVVVPGIHNDKRIDTTSTRLVFIPHDFSHHSVT